MQATRLMLATTLEACGSYADILEAKIALVPFDMPAKQIIESSRLLIPWANNMSKIRRLE